MSRTSILASLLVISCGVFPYCHCAGSFNLSPGPRCPTNLKEYEIAARDQHNFYRSKHQALPLALDDELDLAAQKCAEYYVVRGTIDSTCHFKNTTGENQYATWYQPSAQPSCIALANSATTFWYNGVQDYDFRQPGYHSKAGSFSQVVWKTTKNLGVGCAARNGFAVFVALYSPPGNKLSLGRDPNTHFKYNVLPQGRQTKNLQALSRSSFFYESD